MRLIDANKFIEDMKKLYEDKGWDKHDIHFSLADLIENVEAADTVGFDKEINKALLETYRKGYKDAYQWMTISMEKNIDIADKSVDKDLEKIRGKDNEKKDGTDSE